MAQERLSPRHPDWVWLQSPLEELSAERSAAFDAKVKKQLLGILAIKQFEDVIVLWF